MSKGGGGTVTGYRYLFDILMGVCRGPVDQLVAVRVGDLEVWPAQDDGSHPSLPINDVQRLFNPGSIPPIDGYADATGQPIVGTARFSINESGIFGGDKGEGGVFGQALMQMGEPDQVVPDDVKGSISRQDTSQSHTYDYEYNTHVDTTTGATVVNTGGSLANLPAGDTVIVDNEGHTTELINYISDFRGVATLWYSGQVCSNNPYPKPWKVRVRRALKGWDSNGPWYPAKAVIGFQGDIIRGLNAAHILYQCLTDTAWGYAMDRAEMDDDAWVYAANYLYDEGFGLCIKWTKDTDLNAFVQTIVDHISAALYISRATGLMVLRLIRADYDPNLVPLFNYQSGLLKVDSAETGSSAVIANEVTVNWHDPLMDQDRHIRVQNLASIQATGKIIPETKDYPGLPDQDLAIRAGVRDLRIGSAGLKRMKLTMDRRAWKLQPGSVLAIAAPDKGIEKLLLRVVGYDDGTIANGTITLDCVQDVFGMPSSTYAGVPPSTWAGKQGDKKPQPPLSQMAYEASYYDMLRGLTPAQAAQVGDDQGGIVVLSARPTASSLSNMVTEQSGAGAMTLGAVGSFTPAGTLAQAVDYYDTVLHLASGSDLASVSPDTAAILDGEYVKVTAFDLATGTVTVERGAVDTPPMPHAKGTVIYFSDSVKSARTGAYSAGETVNVQSLTRTLNGVLDPLSATTSTVTVTGRHAQPYPPGNARINGVPALHTPAFYAAGDAVVTWLPRNKVLQADQLVTINDGGVVAEAGTTYTVRVRDHASGTVLREHSGITGLTWTYSDAEAIAGNDPAHVDLVLVAVLAGLESREYVMPLHHVTLAAGGYGRGYGEGWGGHSATAADATPGGYGKSYSFNYGEKA